MQEPGTEYRLFYRFGYVFGGLPEIVSSNSAIVVLRCTPKSAIKLRRHLIHGISISGVTAKVAGLKRISLCALQ